MSMSIIVIIIMTMTMVGLVFLCTLMQRKIALLKGNLQSKEQELQVAKQLLEKTEEAFYSVCKSYQKALCFLAQLCQETKVARGSHNSVTVSFSSQDGRIKGHWGQSSCSGSASFVVDGEELFCPSHPRGPNYMPPASFYEAWKHAS